MIGRHPVIDNSALASSVAGREAISWWAQTRHLGHPAAHAWAATPEFKAEIASYRRVHVDGAVGHMAVNSVWAAEHTVDLARGAQSEAVQRAATRSILVDRMRIMDHADLEPRMVEIERRLDERDAKSNQPRRGTARTGG